MKGKALATAVTGQKEPFPEIEWSCSSEHAPLPTGVKVKSDLVNC